MQMTQMRIKRLNEDAIIPTQGSEYAAGYDLYANRVSECATRSTITIHEGETAKVGTGIAVEIPKGYFGAIYARSGLATKQGLRPANCVGVVDADYRGELIVALHNDSGTDRTVSNGDRIAQLVILPYLAVNFVEVDDLSGTVRGDGGFGSTGVSSVSESVSYE